MKRLSATVTVGIIILIAASACQTDARQQLIATSGSQVALRSIQTRSFQTTDSVRTLTTIIATLQDLEFLIDRADASLGVVTATKTKRLLQLRMSVTIHPNGRDEILVRANGQFERQPVDDPQFYQQFFAALERSMFLSTHDVGAPTGVYSSPNEAMPTALRKAAALPNASPFDGTWLLEIGLADGTSGKDRRLTEVTNGRFTAQFETSGWIGTISGAINEDGMLTATGTVNRKFTWYNRGSFRFESPYVAYGFQKIIQSKARVSESFEIRMTRSSIPS